MSNVQPFIQPSGLGIAGESTFDNIFTQLLGNLRHQVARKDPSRCMLPRCIQAGDQKAIHGIRRVSHRNVDNADPFSILGCNLPKGQAIAVGAVDHLHLIRTWLGTCKEIDAVFARILACSERGPSRRAVHVRHGPECPSGPILHQSPKVWQYPLGGPWINQVKCRCIHANYQDLSSIHQSYTSITTRSAPK